MPWDDDDDWGDDDWKREQYEAEQQEKILGEFQLERLRSYFLENPSLAAPAVRALARARQQEATGDSDAALVLHSAHRADHIG